MSEMLRKVLKTSLKRFDLTILSYSRFNRIEKRSEKLGRVEAALNFILQLPEQNCKYLLEAAADSKAQLFQDLFVLSELGFKRNGFFVEFGATNGVDLSNTHILETKFGWDGILAEPCKKWHADLKKNRACSIETACVWSDSHSTITFNSTEAGELSTIDSFSTGDQHAMYRKGGEKYPVETISLADLLENYEAPGIIDYLSIDTEGSEYEILRNFDFERYRFRVITCEHNFTPKRDMLFSLLRENGYVRKYETLSEHDDWYVGSEANRAHRAQFETAQHCVS